MFKRILSGVIAAAIVLTTLPFAISAKTKNVFYGDINSDKEIDLNDILTLKRYIAEENPSKFNFESADVNADKSADISDLLILKKYLAEWDIRLGPEQISVSFYDNDRLIDVLFADKGEPLGETPTVKKASKADGIFVGWYADSDCTVPFYSENPVNENTKVYAKYDAAKGIEEILTIDSFAKTDVETNYTFKIKGEGGAEAAFAALNLIAKDGSEPPALMVLDNLDGTYTVYADGGFAAGSSYELELEQSFNFVSDGKELPETVRKASFTVDKKIVDTMKINDDIKNIKDTDKINYSRVDSNGDGQYDDTVEQLLSNVSISSEGSVAYIDKADKIGVTAGDIICFYVGTDPKDRVYTGENADAYVGEPTIYVKVIDVTSDEIVFTPLSQDDLNDVYDIPDVFPLKDTAHNNKTNIEKLDISVYSRYGLDNPDIDFAKTKINAGDYVAVFEETPKDNQGDISYGKITDYNAETGEITFELCSADDITASRNMYVKPEIDGDELITDEGKKEIEDIMYSQIEESGFAEEAAYTLAHLSTRTNGFKNMKNLRSVALNDASGKPLTAKEINKLNLSSSFELVDGVKLSVELITSGGKLHFNKGVQLAVGIEASFEVEAAEGKVVIELNATFVEELSIKPTVNGSLTYMRILGIPIPNGVRITANIDVLNYTAYDFDVVAYTIADDDKPLWEQVKNLVNNPSSVTSVLGESGLIPSKYKDRLTKVGDVFEKIEEIEKEINDAKTKYDESKEKLEDLVSDLNALKGAAEVIFENGLCGSLTAEDWKNSAETFGKTNIAQELLHLTDDGFDLDADAGADNDINIKSVDELMEKYSEMLQKETDWITLLDKNICEASVGIYAVNIMLKVDFVIRTDMSIALGSTLEYETGKRYTFWFQFGLYKPTAGSSTMDLIDESLVFQFYVMGKLEIKMGARITLGASIGCSDVAYVGIYAEVGPYVKFYGFFMYTYERMREANTLTSVKKEQKTGALFLETGIYLIVGVEASAIKGLFEISYDFVNAEFPILTAGSKEYPYAFSYELQEDEKVVIKDTDSDSTNGISMKLPDNLRALRTMLLNSGVSIDKVFDYSDYNISLSNPNFSFNSATGEVSVNVPEGIRIMNCEMRLTYKHGKMAFSDYDIGISIPLIWTNLSDSELSEYYTASVRVGNAQDGYKTVWSKRVLKNEAFELPSEDELRKLIGYNSYKYADGAYAQSYDTSNGIIDDKVYDYNVTYREYSITVNGIEGDKPRQTFRAKFGEAFDFSSLAETGRNDAANGEYTIFQNVTTDATVLVGKDANGNAKYETINLESPISERMAQALSAGNVTATANYADNSIKAVFVFRGLLNCEETEQKLSKGGIADFEAIERIAAYNGLAIVDITPSISAIRSTTTYFVVTSDLTGESYTLTFDENGGSAVADITKVGGSLIGILPVPEKTGYTFDGWYTDPELENPFEERLMPKQNTAFFAKWRANRYNVSFHINGGTDETPEDMTAVYDSAYGKLPVPVRVGYSFIGWYTDFQGGTEVKSGDKVTITANQTLYAHWRLLKDIPPNVFDFGEAESYYYDTGISYDIAYTFCAEQGEAYTEDSFTIKYKAQNTDEYIDTPFNPGVYDVLVSRAQDDYYAKFEHLYTGALIVREYIANGSYYTVQAGVRGGVGGSYDVHSDVTWSDGSVSSFNVDIDKSWNSTSVSKSGVYPIKIHSYRGYFNLQNIHLSAHIYDLRGNHRVIQDDWVKKSTTKVDVTWSLGGYPDADCSTKNCEVSKNGKTRVKINTYGLNGVLSGLSYATASNGSNNLDCIAIDGNYFIVDGAKITENQTIPIYARNSNGNWCKVSSFTVSHRVDS